MDWVYAGRCWKFGDNLAVDADLTKKELASQRETRPEVLREYCMCGVDPDFHKKVSPHDIIVAGRRFAQGNPHIQGLLGIAALKLGLVVESIPRGSYRNAINAGLPFLSRCESVTAECETGDELRVNFSTGLFENLTRGTRKNYEPLSATQRDIIALGGWKPMFTVRIATMRAEGKIAAT
jgi:3-isopropylmalate/(R)-2-methylmalate dehydratase small subunit